MADKVVGGKVLMIGDLHISDIFSGKHKNYLANCFGILGQLTKEINEMRPSAIVLLGDLVGNQETNLKSREVLSKFCEILQEWGSIAPIYTVTGNHDLKGFSDLRFMSKLGLVRTAQQCGGYFDYYGTSDQTKPEVRFHLVDYKAEDKLLEIYPETSNIVLGHNNFTVAGLTNWYQEHDGIEIATLTSFSDVDMVVSGHIHNPSPEIVYTKTMGGKTCGLLYAGCPTRPIKDANIYDTTWLVTVEYSELQDMTEIDTKVFTLPPMDEVFYSDDDFVTDKTEDEVQEEIRKDNLRGVLEDLTKYRMNSGDPISQVERIPSGSEEAKALAIVYLNKAFGNA